MILVKVKHICLSVIQGDVGQTVHQVHQRPYTSKQRMTDANCDTSNTVIDCFPTLR